jgi:hypothetical protein
VGVSLTPISGTWTPLHSSATAEADSHAHHQPPDSNAPIAIANTTAPMSTTRLWARITGPTADRGQSEVHTVVVAGRRR